MVPIYKYSAETARYENELTDYRESKRWNIKCKDAIEEAIRTHFDGMHLDTSCVQDIFDEFGYDRTMWVLAATVKNKSFDGRFSSINKGWLAQLSRHTLINMSLTSMLCSHILRCLTDLSTV